MDFLTALKMQGVDFQKWAHKPEVTICCPFCSERGYSADHRYRLGINLRTGIGHCFNCGFRSRHAMNLVAFKFKITGYSPPEEIKEEEQKPEKPALPEDFLSFKKIFNRNLLPEDSLYQMAYDYVKKRATDEQLVKYRIGLSLIGRYAYRIVVPIYYKEELRGIQARDFTGIGQPRYLNTRGIKAVFGIPRAPGHTAVFVEGTFDALGVDRCVNWDAVALMGHTITPEQEEMISCYKNMIFFADANDRGEGLRGFLDIAERMKRGRRIRFTNWTKYIGHDPGSLGEKEIYKRLCKLYDYTPDLALKWRAKLAFMED